MPVRRSAPPGDGAEQVGVVAGRGHHGVDDAEQALGRIGARQGVVDYRVHVAAAAGG